MDLLTNSLTHLRTDAPTHLRTYAPTHLLELGVDLALAVGPVGRDLNVGARLGVEGVSPSFAYSHSSGLFAGLPIAIAASRACPVALLCDVM